MEFYFLLFALFGVFSGHSQTGLRSPTFLSLLSNVASTPYDITNATDFDGVSDYMTRGADLTGNADGKKGTISFWSKWSVDDQVVRRVFNGNYPAGGLPGMGLTVYRGSGYSIYVSAWNAGGTNVLAMSNTSTDFNVAAGWLHFMASWDLATTNTHVYVNGASQKTLTLITNDTIKYTQTNYVVGASTDATDKADCCLADLYVNLAEYVDLSQAANRAKFYNAGPVDLGSDGSTPTSTQPIVFLKNPFGTFQNNLGSGGSFTVTGSLTECASAP